jgi:hypothetical protein
LREQAFAKIPLRTLAVTNGVPGVGVSMSDQVASVRAAASRRVAHWRLRDLGARRALGILPSTLTVIAFRVPVRLGAVRGVGPGCRQGRGTHPGADEDRPL